MICKVEGCGRPYRAKDFCSKHYQRFLKHGDENFTVFNPPNSGSINSNFLKKIKNLRKTCSKKECWIYPDVPMKNGYSTICVCRINGKQIRMLGHRLSYEMYKGPIPKNLVIDHICRTRRCVNPYHLRAVTMKENLYCGINPVFQPFCQKGHPHKAGTGRCKICNREWQRQRRIKNPEKIRAYDRARHFTPKRQKWIKLHKSSYF